MMPVLRVVLIRLLFLTMLQSAIVAQTTSNRGKLAVRVTDSTGAAVGDAAVTLTRGVERTMTTGATRIMRL
jgi:hypothetical protein